MKITIKQHTPRILRVLLAGALALSLSTTAFAQGTTAFTYQGRLEDGTTPATGLYDLKFTLYDAAGIGGIGVGTGPVVISAAGVTNGLFTVSLNFGPTAFPGAARWLEIALRTNGAPAFVTLSPRQWLTPTPYSLYTATAGLAATVYPGSVTTASLAAGAVTATSIADGAVHAAKLASDPNSLGKVAGGKLLMDALGRLVVDPNNANTGSVIYAAAIFGAGATGEGIASKRNVGGNQNGLDFYTDFKSRLSIDNAGNLLAFGDTWLSRHTIYLKDYNDSQHGLGWFGLGNPLGGIYSPDGPILFGYTGGMLLTRGGGDKVALAWDNQQRVGIGKINPATALDVNGTAAISGDLLANRINIGANNTLLSGLGSIAGGQRNVNLADYSFIGGGYNNLIQSNALYASISGGEGNQIQSLSDGTAARFGHIGGGVENAIQPFAWGSVVGGGFRNLIQSEATYAVIGGGWQNLIGTNAARAFIGAGESNRIANDALFATIPGGYLNVAGANFTFAAGQRAKANHHGTFVWADSSGLSDFASTSENQFLIRASGNVGINTNSPGTALDVNGTVTATGFSGPGSSLRGIGTLSLADNSVTAAKLASDGNSLAKVTAGKMSAGGSYLSLTVNEYLNDKDIYLGSGTYHGLGWYGTGKLFAGYNVNGPALYGDTGGALGTTSGGASLALFWDAGGNVGIGGTPGDARLDVKGNLRLNGNDLYLLNGVNRFHGLGWFGSGKAFAGVNVDGPVLYGYSGGGLGFKNSSLGTNMVLQWNTSGSIAMGHNTTASGSFATAMGDNTTASSSGATAMGQGSRASGEASLAANYVTEAYNSYATALGAYTLSGGIASTALGMYSVATGNQSVAMGQTAFASGQSSLAMGQDTTAAASYSTAMGFRAKAQRPGSLVWADSTAFDFDPYAQSGPQGVANSFNVRSTAGFYIATAVNSTNGGITAGTYITASSGGWQNLSDRSTKTGFESVDTKDVLERLASIPITEWNYQDQPDAARHIGPMAQDFNEAFSLGVSDGMGAKKYLSSMDVDGVALAAIQGLNQKLQEELGGVRADNAALKARLDRLEQLISAQNGGGK